MIAQGTGMKIAAEQLADFFQVACVRFDYIFLSSHHGANTVVRCKRKHCDVHCVQRYL